MPRWLAVALVLLLAACRREPDPVDVLLSPSPRQEAPSATAPPVPAAADPALQQQALEQFRSLPGIRHVEWLDGDLILAAQDNGQAWQPVADASCAWLRARGAPASVAVVVLEAGALQNKRWRQLARARCR